MKVRWVGGPLDGCVDNVERPSALWIGPDPMEPVSKGIVYKLEISREVYTYSQSMTDRLNAVLANRKN